MITIIYIAWLSSVVALIAAGHHWWALLIFGAVAAIELSSKRGK